VEKSGKRRTFSDLMGDLDRVDHSPVAGVIHSLQVPPQLGSKAAGLVALKKWTISTLQKWSRFEIRIGRAT